MKRSSQVLFYLFAVLIFISMFRLFSEPPTEDVPYSTFKTLLAEKKSKTWSSRGTISAGPAFPIKKAKKKRPSPWCASMTTTW